MKLQAEGIIANLENIKPCQKSAGLVFEKDGIKIAISDATLDGSIEIALATYSSHSIFCFPDDIIPVSPIVWLCYPQKSPQGLRKTARITLPHCVDCITEDQKDFLLFLKANHANNGADSDGNSEFKFECVNKKKLLFSLEERNGTIEDDHFCFFCIGMKTEADIIGKVQYSITVVKPSEYKMHRKQNLFCVFHYDLSTCKSVCYINKTVIS